MERCPCFGGNRSNPPAIIDAHAASVGMQRLSLHAYGARSGRFEHDTYLSDTQRPVFSFTRSGYFQTARAAWSNLTLETDGPGGNERSTIVHRLIGKLLLLHGSYRLLIGEHRRAVFRSIPSSSPYVPLPSSLFPLLSLVSGCASCTSRSFYTDSLFDSSLRSSLFQTFPTGLYTLRTSSTASIHRFSTCTPSPRFSPSLPLAPPRSPLSLFTTGGHASLTPASPRVHRFQRLFLSRRPQFPPRL